MACSCPCGAQFWYCPLPQLSLHSVLTRAAMSAVFVGRPVPVLSGTKTASSLERTRLPLEIRLTTGEHKMHKQSQPSLNCENATTADMLIGLSCMVGINAKYVSGIRRNTFSNVRIVEPWRAIGVGDIDYELITRTPKTAEDY